MISGIIKVEASVISRDRRPSLVTLAALDYRISQKPHPIIVLLYIVLWKIYKNYCVKDEEKLAIVRVVWAVQSCHLSKICHHGSRYSKYAKRSHFTVLICKGRLRAKCTEIYNARAQSLFCSLNLLFGGVLVAVAVVSL